MVQEKSTGLKFAEEQLLRHGWEKGKSEQIIGPVQTVLYIGNPVYVTIFINFHIAINHFFA